VLHPVIFDSVDAEEFLHRANEEKKANNEYRTCPVEEYFSVITAAESGNILMR